MGYDPSTNAAILAALETRCLTTYPEVGCAFTLVSSATMRLRGTHPMQIALIPTTSNRIAISWAAFYRWRKLHGHIIVVDATQQDLGQAFVLADAQTALDLCDRQLLASGAGGNPFAPNSRVNMPIGAYNPLLVGDARWTDAP